MLRLQMSLTPNAARLLHDMLRTHTQSDDTDVRCLASHVQAKLVTLLERPE